MTNLKLIVASVFAVAVFSCDKNSCVNQVDLRVPQNFDEAMQHEFDKTHDPKTGTIPFERLLLAEQYYNEMSNLKTKTDAPFSNIKWQERGPNNIGGRTRAILFLSAKKVLAAGVSGGLWK